MSVPRLRVIEYVLFGHCWSCGVEIYGPKAKFEQTQNNGGDFYCINGHPACFSESRAKKAEAAVAQLEQRLKAALARETLAQNNARSASRSAAIVKGKLKAQTARIKNGVCPCCNRSFENLQRHMKTKHPKWGAENSAHQ